MRTDEKDTALYTAFEEVIPYDPALPERNLLRAIILTALTDLKKPGDLNRQATEFFLSNDEHYIFSFQSICNHLDVDPKRVLTVAGLRDKVRNS